MELNLQEEINKLEQTLQSVYRDRNNIVQLLAVLLNMQGIKAGIRIGTENDEWPVVAMDLPFSIDNKQIAWHIPKDQNIISDISYDMPYDGHTNEEKEQHIKNFINKNLSK